MTEPLTTALPEFTISSTMRAAASSVAASFHAYQQSCFDMQTAEGAEAMKTLLQSQRERRQAYQLAMKFLSAAALKANPAYDLSKRDNMNAKQAEELAPLLDRYLETRLNKLIASESAANPLIRNTAEHHPVIAGPW